MKIILKFLMIFFALICNNILAQYELKITTDKSDYSYGEPIIITCTIKNTTDSNLTFWASNYSTCQAEFIFNDFYSEDYEVCLPSVEPIEFGPMSERSYQWTINPVVFGLPNKEGQQMIIAYFKEEQSIQQPRNLRDTVYFNAQKFIGGQLALGFAKNDLPHVDSLKSSLSINTINSTELNGNFSEVWRFTSLGIDSMRNFLSADSVFEYVEFDRFTSYDSIYVTDIREEELNPSQFFVSEAYPNPFNPTTQISIIMNKSQKVGISLYNILGEKIDEVFNGILNINQKYDFQVDSGNLSSGIYFIRVNSEESVISRKILLLK